MSANTPVARLDTLPAATLDKLLALADKADELLALQGLPSVSSTSNGKVLTVVSGKWKAANVPAELPAVTADDNGKVLTVVSGAWAVPETAQEET